MVEASKEPSAPKQVPGVVASFPMNRLARAALRSLLALLILLALVWLGDYVSFRYRFSQRTPSSPLERIRVQRTYAIPHKDGRAEYVFGQPEMVTCAHSIFPHSGCPPCWYLRRTSSKPISM